MANVSPCTYHRVACDISSLAFHSVEYVVMKLLGICHCSSDSITSLLRSLSQCLFMGEHDDDQYIEGWRQEGRVFL